MRSECGYFKMNVMTYRILTFKLWLLRQLMAFAKLTIMLAVKISLTAFRMNKKAERKRDDLSE